MQANIIDSINFSNFQHHHDWLRYLGKAKLRVLFVTDGRFTDTNSVYNYMQGKTLGCTTISVKRAMYTYGNGALSINATPDDNEPHYGNFKFDSSKPGGGSILDDFDVMYIFAVSSGSPETFDDGELAALHEWMNAGHGVFATGDHSVLGQRMGSRIPRVGSMRKWTNDDEVPPGTGNKRIDTNQPDPNNPGQVDGSVVIPNSAQRDEFPQKISVIPFTKIRLGHLREAHYPHEILCHPTHGAIDVMPDHPHEGECFRPRDIELDSKVRFATTVGDDDEYPEVGGARERPAIIATGKNSHQYFLSKGEVDPYTFNMISVYDGYKANVGRVVVDSTWHHWYGMNIDGLINDGGENWEKIGRYFLNIAKYLAPKGLYRNRCALEVIDAQFDYPFYEEYVWDKGLNNIYDIGISLNESLSLRSGKCGVIKFVIQALCEYKPWLCKLLERETIPEIDPRGPGPACLSCPPIDVLINYALGGIALQTEGIRESLKSHFSGESSKRKSIEVKEIDERIAKGVALGVDEFLKQLASDLKLTEKTWRHYND